MFVFFDIGDTLVDEADFARFRHASIYEFLTRRGCPVTQEQYSSDLNNLSMQGRMTLFDQLLWLAQRNGGDTLLAMAIFRDYILRVAPEAPQRFVPFPDARDTLRALTRHADGERRGYRLGIIANQPTWIRARMVEWGLLEYFAAGSIVISDEVAVSKPRPEIFQFALQQAGVTAREAVMVGNDYINDIAPAKQLGFSTIWIERDDPYAPGAPPILDPLAADVRVSQLAEVPAALRRLAARRLGAGASTGHGPGNDAGNDAGNGTGHENGNGNGRGRRTGRVRPTGAQRTAPVPDKRAP
jgi:FMN phosphatase YigB (HAD superfamily)